MTRKDFIVIAEIVKGLESMLLPEQREIVAEQFAAGLCATNGRFKPELFIQAATGQVPLNARRAVDWSEGDRFFVAKVNGR